MKSVILFFVLLLPLSAFSIEGSPRGTKLHLTSGSDNPSHYLCNDTCVNIQLVNGTWQGWNISVYPGSNDYLSNLILPTDSTDQSPLGEVTINGTAMYVVPLRSTNTYLQTIPLQSCSDATIPCTPSSIMCPILLREKNNPLKDYCVVDSNFSPKWDITEFVKSGTLAHMVVTGFLYDFNCPACVTWPHRAPVRISLSGEMSVPNSGPVINYVRSAKGSTYAHIYGIKLSDVNQVFWNGNFVPALVMSSTHIQIIKPATDNPGAVVRAVSPVGEYTYTFY